VPTLDTGRRVGLAEVELGFTPEQARCEANRCLRCFANIMLDTSKCVLCALCADVCPVDVISLVPSEEVDPDQPGGTVLLLDEERCIRCALVHRALPTRRPVDGACGRAWACHEGPATSPEPLSHPHDHSHATTSHGGALTDEPHRRTP
jgi:ferredoxin